VLNGLAWSVFGLFVLKPRDRRLLAAVFVAGLGGLVCTFIGGDLAHNVLVVELQPWRAMWLLQVVVRLFIPLIFFSLLARRSANPFLLAAMLSTGLVLASSTTRLIRLPYSADFGFLSFALMMIALAAIFARLAWKEQKHPRVVQLFGALAILAVPVAVWDWDGRSPWTRFLESPEPPPADLAGLLAQNASVYWENSTEMLWFRLKRPSYFSCDQGTGVVFHRETAMAYRHRSDSFWPLRTADFTNTRSCAGFDTSPKPERARQGLERLCRREPALDTVVLIAPIPEVEPKIWKSPILFQDVHVADGIYSERSTDRFYAYTCSTLR